MTAHEDLIVLLDEEIKDAEEETFLLYSQPLPSQNLGFVDRTARQVDVSVGGRDYTIQQSPGVLSSNRAGGTTGAVVWKLNVHLASWLASPTNFLFSPSPSPTTPSPLPSLDHSSAVLELGCGISPLNALALRARVASHLLTDQPYVQKLLRQNLDDNAAGPVTTSGSREKPRRAARKTPQTSSTTSASTPTSTSSSSSATASINFTPLDWETDDAASTLRATSPAGFDAVLASDCIYNYALVDPFVQTCRDACALRPRLGLGQDHHGGDHAPSPTSLTGDNSDSVGTESTSGRPTLCIVAQQLRNDDVFLSWLCAFLCYFRAWRVPETLLPVGMRPADGFVVHIGMLK